MKKHYVGLNLLDRVMKADSIKDMLRIIKPSLDRDRYSFTISVPNYRNRGTDTWLQKRT